MFDGIQWMGDIEHSKLSLHQRGACNCKYVKAIGGRQRCANVQLCRRVL